MNARREPQAAPPVEPLADILTPWLPTQRWFAGKGHTLTQVVVTDAVPLSIVSESPHPGADPGAADAATNGSPGAPSVLHLVVGVQIDGGGWQTYQIPVSIYEPAGLGELGERLLVGRLPDGRVVAGCSDRSHGHDRAAGRARGPARA